VGKPLNRPIFGRVPPHDKFSLSTGDGIAGNLVKDRMNLLWLRLSWIPGKKSLKSP